MPQEVNMNALTVIIETPGGSAQKYDYDKKLKCFKWHKVLPAGMVFPFDFGFIPDTKGEDGDPLDVIAISELKSFTGCAMDCRIIGAIKALQTERNGGQVRNDRFLGIPVESEMFRDINSIKELPENILKQIEDFFKNYNEASGKKFEVLERVDNVEAYRLAGM